MAAFLFFFFLYWKFSICVLLIVSSSMIFRVFEMRKLSFLRYKLINIKMFSIEIGQKVMHMDHRKRKKGNKKKIIIKIISWIYDMNICIFEYFFLLRSRRYWKKNTQQEKVRYWNLCSSLVYIFVLSLTRPNWDTFILLYATTVFFFCTTLNIRLYFINL